jgi:hypothetical protein
MFSAQSGRCSAFERAERLFERAVDGPDVSLGGSGSDLLD